MFYYLVLFYISLYLATYLASLARAFSRRFQPSWTALKPLSTNVSYVLLRVPSTVLRVSFCACKSHRGLDKVSNGLLERGRRTFTCPFFVRQGKFPFQNLQQRFSLFSSLAMTHGRTSRVKTHYQPSEREDGGFPTSCTDSLCLFPLPRGVTEELTQQNASQG